MEIQLQELIEQIKKDGVEAAEGKAAAIIGDANAEAEKIIADAKAEADNLLQQARKEAERLARANDDALRQAGRNLLIAFRESVNRELNAVIAENVTAAYTPEALKELIINMVQGWTANTDAEDITVLLGSRDMALLEGSLLAALKDRMLTGVTLKANDDFAEGFRIAVDNGRAYYDYSAAAVTEMLSAYLNPRMTALLKEAEG